MTSSDAAGKTASIAINTKTAQSPCAARNDVTELDPRRSVRGQSRSAGVAGLSGNPDDASGGARVGAFGRVRSGQNARGGPVPHPIKGGAAPTALYYRRYRRTCH